MIDVLAEAQSVLLHDLSHCPHHKEASRKARTTLRLQGLFIRKAGLPGSKQKKSAADFAAADFVENVSMVGLIFADASNSFPHEPNSGERGSQQKQ